MKSIIKNMKIKNKKRLMQLVNLFFAFIVGVIIQTIDYSIDTSLIVASICYATLFIVTHQYYLIHNY